MRRIDRLSEFARAFVAAGAARRLMDQHLSLPEERKMPFTVTWASTVSVLWDTVSSPSADRNRYLAAKLKDYYSGPYCHELGELALPGADDDAASAAIYATEAYCTGDSKAAGRAAMQLVTDAQARANTITEERGEDLMSTDAGARRFRFQEIELDRLDEATSLLENEGLTGATLPHLQRIFLDD